jgi:replication factor A1
LKAWEKPRGKLSSLYTSEAFIVDLSEIFQEEEPTARTLPLFQDILAKIHGAKTMNYKEPIIIEHLAFLSVKHNLYLSELYQALISARAIGKSTCGELTINHRGIINHQAVFLITKVNKVIMQFRVDEAFLLRKNISFESWLDTDKIRRQMSKQNLEVDLTFIQNLRRGMKKINLKAEVLMTAESKIVNTQYGSRVKVTDIWIADETGKVKLCLWGEQTSLPSVGDMVQIKGASVRTFKGDNLLSLGRYGSLTILQQLLVNSDLRFQ